jgi:O-antigen/teichoic acid export membrane protein
LVPAGLAVVVLVILLGRALRRRADDRVRCAPPEDKRLSRKALVGFTWRDGTASCTTFGLILIMPFLTTWLAGPVQGAMVAMALAVAQVLDFVPDGMGAALTAHFANSPSGMNSRIRRMWALATSIVAVGAAGLAICSPVIGWIFGEAYRTVEFRWCLSLLALSCLLRVPYSLWISVLRATMATRTLLRFNVSAAVFTLPVVLVLTDRHGSVGAAAGLCVASAVLGAAGSWDLCRRWCKR